MTITVNRVDTRRMVPPPGPDGTPVYCLHCDGCDRPSEMYVGTEPTPEQVAEYECTHACTGERITWLPGADA